MELQVGTLTGTIQATAAPAALSSESTQAIVTLVLAALDERNRRAAQAASDTKIGSDGGCGAGCGE